MVIRVWRTHGQPVDRVAKRGIYYEPQPEPAEWSYRDRSADDLASDLDNAFTRVRTACQARKHPGDDRNQHRLGTALIALFQAIERGLKSSHFAVCAAMVDAHVRQLADRGCWDERANRNLIDRLGPLRKNLYWEQLPTFDSLLEGLRRTGPKWKACSDSARAIHSARKPGFHPHVCAVRPPDVGPQASNKPKELKKRK